MTFLNNNNSTHKQLSVLVSPLDWGLGHATRCIPLIAYLLELNCRISVAGEGAVIELIKKEFPTIECIPLRGYRIQYPKQDFFFIPKLLIQLPKIISSIIREHQWLTRQLKEKKWDWIISDNRYGLYSPHTNSIFITHQPKIITGLGKWIDGLAARLLKHQIEKFNCCWIPDISSEQNIAGKLDNADGLPVNIRYIGPVSRLNNSTAQTDEHILVLLSGPEPQRSILEHLLIDQLKDSNEKILFIRGLPLAEISMAPTHNITFKNHLSSRELSLCMSAAKMVICRSGYSTIMDLLKLNKKALLIPTPGQTEQGYLAERLSKFGWFVVQQQDELNVIEALPRAINLSKPRPILDFEGYKQAFSQIGIQ